MKTIELRSKARCEMPNCKNYASIKIIKEGFFRSAGLFLCNDCAKDLHLELSKRIVPKSPDNMLNKRIKTRKESYVEKEEFSK